MRNGNVVRTARLVLAAAILLPLGGTATASTDYAVNIDRNFFVRAIDSINSGAETSVLVLTYPASNQPHVREGCTANFYVLKVSPGLGNSKLLPLATNYCGHRLDRSGRLLGNGDALLMIEGNVETWRPGVGKVGGWSVSDVDALERHHPAATRSFRVIDAYTDGTIAYAGGLPRARGDTETPSAIIAGLSQDGEVRWDHVFAEPGVILSAMDIWGTADGGALLHATASPMRGRGYPEGVAPPGMTGSENRLYRFSAMGEVSKPIVIASFSGLGDPPELPDMQTDPEGFREALDRYVKSGSFESYAEGQLIGSARPDGSVDLLLGRGTREIRIMHIDSSGKVVLDETLTDPMKSKERPPWGDGFVDGNTVTVFGELGLTETRLSQGYVSRFDLESRELTTRLAPLEGPGLEAAIRARDEEIQHLEHYPSQQSQILARLADQPLMISLIKRSRKQALQLTEVDNSLQLYPVERERATAALRQSQPRSVTPATLPSALPAVMSGDCDCSCEALTTMTEKAEALQSEAKATGQPPPVKEFMLVSQCMLRCQSQVMACMRAQ